MSSFPEVEKPQSPIQQEKGVEIIPEEPQMTPEITGEGISSVPTQAQSLQDDTGQVIAQPVQETAPPQPSAGSVIIPADDQKTLETWSKKDPSYAITWQGVLLLRKIKKAFAKGFQVIFKRS